MTFDEQTALDHAQHRAKCMEESFQFERAAAARLERVNADHVAVRTECEALLCKIRAEVQKHEDEPPPKGFSWVTFCELGDRMSCLLRGIKIE